MDGNIDFCLWDVLSKHRQDLGRTNQKVWLGWVFVVRRVRKLAIVKVSESEKSSTAPSASQQC